MAFNVNNLTVGELAKVEEISGQAYSALADEDSPKFKTLAALAFVIKRREDPKFTPAQAEALTLNELNGLIDFSGESDPEE
jgi:hypothetical protein